MKKSSIAIFTLFGLMMLFSFFLSAITMQRSMAAPILKAANSFVKQQLPPFHSIHVLCPSYPYIRYSDSNDSTPRPCVNFTIKGNTLPGEESITMDYNWAQNMKVEVEDSTLFITIDAHTLLDPEQKHYDFLIEPELANVMEINLPGSMLRRIDGRGFLFYLDDIQHGNLIVRFADLECQNCDFSSLSTD